MQLTSLLLLLLLLVPIMLIMIQNVCFSVASRVQQVVLCGVAMDGQ